MIKLVLGDRNINSISDTSFFFIMGSGRNGSTLLSAILNEHAKIFIPPEQFVLPYYAMEWQLSRNMSDNLFVDRLFAAYTKPGNTVNWTVTFDQLQKGKYDLLKTPLSYENITKRVFLNYGNTLGKYLIESVGDNSPLMTHHSKLISEEFPRAKFIYLIRDPREVVYSYSKMKDHPASNINHAIWKWKDSIRMYEYLKRKKKDVLLIHYKDLVSFPEESMEKVLSFLGYNYDPDIFSFSEHIDAMGVSNLEYHQNLNNPINTSSLNKWRGKLNEAELRLIRKSLGKLASKYDYDLSD
ncbi:MAG: hypothetical protein CMB80_21920 [Flammeovirgaceae bacterium]|nr:hypothetical protein [Flammeovirgaceae bacterium]